MKKMKCIGFLNRGDGDSVPRGFTDTGQVLFDAFVRAASGTQTKKNVELPSSHIDVNPSRDSPPDSAAAVADMLGNISLLPQENVTNPFATFTTDEQYEFRPVGTAADSSDGASSRPASSSTTDTQDRFTTRRKKGSRGKGSKRDTPESCSPHEIFNVNVRETDILNDDPCSPLETSGALTTLAESCRQEFFYPPPTIGEYQIEDLDSPSGDEVFSYTMQDTSQEMLISDNSDLVYGFWEQGGERVVWEYHNVQLTRVPTYGFGIAVSGGRDNPHFRNGDPSVAISEVLKNGPAEGKLEVNDRLISANGISLENVDYGRAVQILRDSGQTVHLVVKRRIVLPITPEPQTLKVSLTKNKKKDDFGVVLGCRIYVKEIVNHTIADKDGGLREGDVLLKINNSSTENLSLKEARKLIDGSKEKLQLLVRRENPGYSPQLSPDFPVKDGRSPNFSETRPNYSTQNLYVQPPTRGSDASQHRGIPFHEVDAKNNLRRYNNPNQVGFSADGSGGFLFDDPNPLLEDGAPPPRPPLPRPEDYFTRNAPPPVHADPNSPAKANGPPPPEPRFVSFKKEGSVGIRLTGGNEVGIFVTAVQPKSQAQLQGLIAGDKILKVNDMDMTGVTREEAVLYLMSLQDQIDLIVQTRVNDYQQILSSQKGDLFYVRTHFHYDPSGKSELSFRSGDIFRVVDTLHNGVVGAWQVHRIGRNNQETQKGIIPNKARAEELATAQFNAAKKEQTQSESRSGFFKRRRNSRRSKSLGKDHWEDVVFADSVSKFPAYERVTLRHPGFVRPVVLFGPLADVAREKLLKENPEKFASPQLDSSGEKPSGIIRLSAIREILERGKHAVLDITPNAVDRLNYAQFYPIVIFLRAESKQTVKELRSGIPKGRMSSKKLYDQSVKLEKLWSHVFTSTISLTQPDTWYKKMKEAVDKQQDGPIWMSEAKPSEALTDDFLFPMTSRLSYASSPESDLETGPESRTPSKSPQRAGGLSSHSGPSDLRDSRGRLVKSSSDPSIAAQEDTAPTTQPGPPPYTASPMRMPATLGQNENFDDRKKSQGGGDSKYGFSSSNYFGPDHNNQFLNRSPPHSVGLPTISRSREDNSKVENADNDTGNLNVSPYGQTPQNLGSRNGHALSLPPNALSSPQSASKKSPHMVQLPHSPHTANHAQQMPLSHPSGRSPPKSSVNYSSPNVGGLQSSPPPLPIYNSHPHLGDPSSQPDLPPKVNRASKPNRLRSTSQDRSSGQDFPPVNDFSDNNYINTIQGSNLEKQNKSPYDTAGIPLGPNAHDDLKSRMHLRSPQDHYRYNRSSSQPPQYLPEDPYRLASEYKPIPPPKSGNYKPVPPPKPKHYRGGVVGPEGGGSNQNWGFSDMRKGYDRGPYQTNGNGGLSDDYSGMDSGQGSSLDRKYDTVGRASYSKISSSSSRSGYYLNVPPPRDNSAHQGSSSRDLPNHDHRGSAFELYKKPADPRNPLMALGPLQVGGPYPVSVINQGFSNQLPSYVDPSSRYSLVDEGNHKVIATARGVYDHKGGTLASEETGVSVVIPPEAISKGKKQEIYFKVCQDSSLIPPLDQEKGETLLSPLVMCGPHGLQFKKPVELRLPHAATVSPNTWSFALKSSETPSGHNPTQWTNVSLGDQPSSKASVSSNCVSVLVDHF